MWTPFDATTVEKEIYAIRGTAENGVPFEYEDMYPNGTHFHRTIASPAPATVPYSQVTEVKFQMTLEEQFAKHSGS